MSQDNTINRFMLLKSLDPKICVQSILINTLIKILGGAVHFIKKRYVAIFNII